MNNKFVDKVTKPFNFNALTRTEETKPLKDEIFEREDSFKQVFLQVERPKIKFTNDYVTPNNIGDLVDDVILYILSYLQVDDLLLVALLNKNWNNVSNNNTIWEPVFKQKKWRFKKNLTLSSDNYKNSYIEAMKTEKSITQIIKNTETKENMTTVMIHTSRTLYGLSFPILFMIGLIILTVILPIIIDGTLQFNQQNSVWIFFIFAILCLLTYILMVFCIGFDPIFMVNLRKKYWIHREELLTDKIPDETPYSEDYDSILTSNMFIWGMAWLPLSILCVLLKGMLFPQLQFSIAFIPVYVYSIIYTCINPCILYDVLRCFTTDYSISFSGLILHSAMVSINLWAALQVLFIGLRLDNLMGSANWGVVFIPTWIILTLLFVCTIPFCFCSIAFYNSPPGIGWILILSIGPCCVAPIMLFMILLTIRLEGIFFGISYVVVFIPCLILEILFCSCLSFCSIFSLLNGFYSKEQ